MFVASTVLCNPEPQMVCSETCINLGGAPWANKDAPQFSLTQIQRKGRYNNSEVIIGTVAKLFLLITK